MKTIAKWEIFQVDFPIELSCDNPFLDVELKVMFKKNHLLYSIDGFYDGIEDGLSIWKARFAPMDEGEWYYETYSNIADLNNITGSFVCVKEESKGGLACSNKYPNWFFRQNGEPQLVVNDGWYPHAANGHWISYEDVDYQQPSEKDMEDFIDLLADNGVNLFVDMGQLYARQESITDISFQWPWKVIDAKNNKIDKDSFNLLYYQRMERMLAYAKKKGVFFALELLFDNSTVRTLEWSHHPMNYLNGGWLKGDEWGIGWNNMFDINNEEHKEYTMRYIRYTIARLSCYWNICWEIGGENANLSQLPEWMLPHAQVPNEQVASWYNYWGDYIKQKDVYQRLCTYGDTTYMELMVKGPGNDFVLTQDPRNYPRDDIREYYKAMSRYGAFYWQFERPMVIGEMNSFNNGNYGRERRLYWTAMVSGYMMGRSDRHFGIMEDGKLVESRKFCCNNIPPIYSYLKILKEYIENKVPFYCMSPANELIYCDDEDVIFCLSDKDSHYLIYYLFGGEATICVSKVHCEWMNPRTGEIICEDDLEAGKHTLKAPDNQDWVLYLYR